MARTPGRGGGRRGGDGGFRRGEDEAGDHGAPRNGEAFKEIDARLGALLGPLGDVLGRLVDAAEEARGRGVRGDGGPGAGRDSGSGPRRGAGSGGAPDPDDDPGDGTGPDEAFDRGALRASAGFRVRMGGQEFGHDLPITGTERPGRSREGGAARAAGSSTRFPSPPAGPPPPRTPAHECWTENGVWTLTAEVPGAAADDLTLHLEGATLVAVIAGPRPWRIETPAPVADLGAIEARLVHGILELTAQAPG